MGRFKKNEKLFKALQSGEAEIKKIIPKKISQNDINFVNENKGKIEEAKKKLDFLNARMSDLMEVESKKLEEKFKEMDVEKQLLTIQRSLKRKEDVFLEIKKELYPYIKEFREKVRRFLKELSFRPSVGYLWFYMANGVVISIC